MSTLLATDNLEKAHGDSNRPDYRLCLYTCGNTAKSTRAIENITRICAELLADHYVLDVVDIHQQPELAAAGQIVAAPTLIKTLPLPLRRIIGDLSDTERVLIALNIPSTKKLAQHAADADIEKNRALDQFMEVNAAPDILLQFNEVRTELEGANESLLAIRRGEVDAVVVAGPGGERIYSLKDAETPYRVLVEAMSEGALVMTGDGTIVYGNSAFGRLLDVPLEHIIGSSFYRFVPAPQMVAFNDLLERGREANSKGEIMLNSQPDGDVMPALISIARMTAAVMPGGSLTSPTDDAASVAMVVTDLTETKKKETELDEHRRKLEEKNTQLGNANLAKDRFLATMSHELRTPLNAIIGFTGTLLMELPGPLNSEQGHQLKTIKTSANHLLSLINDLLDLAKIESGKVEVQLDNVPCFEIIEEVVASLRPLAEAKGLRILAGNLTPNLLVRADRRAFGQILINLVNNSIKFTEQGDIEIITERREHADSATMTVSISDTGVGIAEAVQDKVFGPFTQFAEASGTRPQGTGLGLYLSQKLAHLMDGDITFVSRIGKGSTFALTLPCV